MRHKFRLQKTGFTLLEIMVAISIIAIVFMSVFKMHAQTVSMTASTRFYAVAPILAKNRLAEFLSQSPEELSDDSGDFGNGYAGYGWKIAIEDVESENLETDTDRLKRIDVMISVNNEENTYRLRTYRFIIDQ
ncbi:MAG: prepilin-type N-terminal cleavage/methylation domain-containing protein [Deltaproteobacteria bacterium]|nr:prepilin-type N-terminal cleavage/methylation domain-containing protein [Deltaproteobacteria bacterium]